MINAKNWAPYLDFIYQLFTLCTNVKFNEIPNDFPNIFKDIIQDIVTALTHKLQELKEKSISIIIPQLEKTQVDNSKIILGEFDNYQIILKKK